jgi:tetratricopeptide (TPR) repeat protein
VTDETFVRKRATELIGEGREQQRRGQYERAIELYSKALGVYPSAEAFTYRAWANAQAGRYETAIADCHAAIEVDPSLGNPYNDLGSYLVRLGRTNEAIEWLQRAKQAERYENRHFPYMNLARIFALKGQLHRAIEEIEGALHVRPDDPTCQRVLTALRATLN